MPLLHWLTRDQDLTAADRVPYRLLDEVPELSVPDPAGGAGGNLLVQGDNLHALRALLPFYAGRVKCICIDPPYNTGPPSRRYRRTVLRAQPNSLARRLAPQPSSLSRSIAATSSG